MDARLHQLHLQAGLISGRDKTCGTKHAYAAEEQALQAANAHNRWQKRGHDVEPYPCAFCAQWHIGRIMPVEILEAICAQGGSHEEKK